MGLGLTKQSSTGSVPAFQNVIENAQGGFNLIITGLTIGDTIPAGSVMGYDESTRKATLLKTAEIQANATDSATAYRVKKGHQFKVGDYIAAVIGGKAYAITVIDTSNAAYDELTVGTTLAVALSAGDSIFKSSATGAAAAVLDVTPKGLLYQDVIVAANESVAIVIRGTAYARRIPSSTAAIKATLPLIIFSQSY